MPQQYSRFDKMFNNPEKPIPPYAHKEYPKLITVGIGKDAQRIKVHDKGEEDAALEQHGKPQMKAVLPVPGVPAFDAAVEAEVQRRTSEAAEAMQKQLAEMNDRMHEMAETLRAKDVTAKDKAADVAADKAEAQTAADKAAADKAAADTAARNAATLADAQKNKQDPLKPAPKLDLKR